MELSLFSSQGTVGCPLSRSMILTHRIVVAPEAYCVFFIQLKVNQSVTNLNLCRHSFSDRQHTSLLGAVTCPVLEHRCRQRTPSVES